jgi:hypothetical protein
MAGIATVMKTGRRGEVRMNIVLRREWSEVNRSQRSLGRGKRGKVRWRDWRTKGMVLDVRVA